MAACARPDPDLVAALRRTARGLSALAAVATNGSDRSTHPAGCIPELISALAQLGVVGALVADHLDRLDHVGDWPVLVEQWLAVTELAIALLHTELGEATP